MSDVIDTEATLQVAEQALDAIDEQIDGIVETMEVVRNNPKLIAAAAVGGLVVGGVIGYFVAVNRLKAHYDEIIQREIEEARDFYANVHKTDGDGNPLTPEQVYAQIHGEEALEALLAYKGEKPAPTEEDLLDEELADRAVLRARERMAAVEVEGRPDIEAPATIQAKFVEADKVEVDEDGTMRMAKVQTMEEVVEEKNIFDRSAAEFDFETELKHRTPDAPYVITHDEYFENGPEHDQITMTYYEEDDILADDQDLPLPTFDVVGEDHLVKFGYGSRDPNIVYIRNERKGMDIEVVRSPGSYSREVAGFEEPKSLRHSADYVDRRRAFRRGDD